MIREADRSDIPRLNEMLNHPDVKPTAGLKSLDDLDVSPLFNRRNIILIAEYGGAIFAWSAPGIYEGHSFFLPEGRGEYALTIGRQMLDLVFAKGATRIWGQTPVEYRAARMFNRKLGFKSIGFDIAPFPCGEVKVELFQMEALCR